MALKHKINVLGFQSPRGTGLEALWIARFSKCMMRNYEQSDNCIKKNENKLLLLLLLLPASKWNSFTP